MAQIAGSCRNFDFAGLRDNDIYLTSNTIQLVTTKITVKTKKCRQNPRRHVLIAKWQLGHLHLTAAQFWHVSTTEQQ